MLLCVCVREREMYTQNMGSSKLFEISLMILASLVCANAAADSTIQARRDFIARSCLKTQYPSVCLSSLQRYTVQIQTSPRELAHAALLVSLAKARSMSVKISRLEEMAKGSASHREVSAMKDCVENVAETIDMLKESLGEMKHLKRKNWGLEMNDLQTWVSAALTDEDTCTEGFAGKIMNGPIKEDVKVTIRKVAQLTSNALDFVNQLSHTKGEMIP